MDQLVAYDRILSARLSALSKRRLMRAGLWLCARSGDSWLWLVIITVLVWRRQSVGMRLLLALSITAIIVFVTKAIFKRERPLASRLAFSADRYAFPSGHAARAGGMAVTISLAYPAFAWIYLLWASLVCVARVALSKHYLSDVVGGLALGTLVGLALRIVV